MSVISTCGLDCNSCPAYQADCEGCRECGGVTPWLEETELAVCPLYDCPVNQKGLRDCGDCPDLPCGLYHDFRDPAVSPEEHEKGIAERVARLRG